MPLAVALLRSQDPWAVARRLAECATDVATFADGGVCGRSPAGEWSARPAGRDVTLLATAADAEALASLCRGVAEHVALAAPDAGGPVWQAPFDGADIDIVGPVATDYVNRHCPSPDDVLADLIAETRVVTRGHAGMQVSPDEGSLLTLLTRMVGARRAVEVGTFTGYSSICIARGLVEGGRLLTCDMSPEWMDVARRYWARAGLSEVIDPRLGPALDTLRSLPEEPTIDLAFIDADKDSYPAYYEQLVPRLRPGGLVLIDNVFLGGRVFDPSYREPHHLAVRELNELVCADPRVDAVMLPVRDGLTIARRQ